jgi:hypothetical protein
MASLNSVSPFQLNAQDIGARANSEANAGFQDRRYLQRIQSLDHAFPALKSFLGKIQNVDAGRQIVRSYYQDNYNRVPGRCYGLQFETDKVSSLEGYPDGFASPQALEQYLSDHPATVSRENNKCRLFILEDMEPDYVNALGHHLGVDPLVFCEQMNTWNFTDSNSIPYRGLPSLTQPKHSFTMRYYEIRTLGDPGSVDPLNFQMTFAVNRRKYERWRDIDLSPDGSSDSGNAFIRRCTSFWTSQGRVADRKSEGWDGKMIILL